MIRNVNSFSNVQMPKMNGQVEKNKGMMSDPISMKASNPSDILNAMSMQGVQNKISFGARVTEAALKSRTPVSRVTENVSHFPLHAVTNRFGKLCGRVSDFTGKGVKIDIDIPTYIRGLFAYAKNAAGVSGLFIGALVTGIFAGIELDKEKVKDEQLLKKLKILQEHALMSPDEEGRDSNDETVQKYVSNFSTNLGASNIVPEYQKHYERLLVLFNKAGFSNEETAKLFTKFMAEAMLLTPRRLTENVQNYVKDLAKDGLTPHCNDVFVTDAKGCIHDKPFPDANLFREYASDVKIINSVNDRKFKLTFANEILQKFYAGVSKNDKKHRRRGGTVGQKLESHIAYGARDLGAYPVVLPENVSVSSKEKGISEKDYMAGLFGYLAQNFAGSGFRAGIVLSDVFAATPLRNESPAVSKIQELSIDLNSGKRVSSDTDVKLGYIGLNRLEIKKAFSLPENTPVFDVMLEPFKQAGYTLEETAQLVTAAVADALKQTPRELSDNVFGYISSTDNAGFDLNKMLYSEYEMSLYKPENFCEYLTNKSMEIRSAADEVFNTAQNAISGLEKVSAEKFYVPRPELDEYDKKFLETNDPGYLTGTKPSNTILPLYKGSAVKNANAPILVKTNDCATADTEVESNSASRGANRVAEYSKTSADERLKNMDSETSEKVSDKTSARTGVSGTSNTRVKESEKEYAQKTPSNDAGKTADKASDISVNKPRVRIVPKSETKVSVDDNISVDKAPDISVNKPRVRIVPKSETKVSVNNNISVDNRTIGFIKSLFGLAYIPESKSSLVNYPEITPEEYADGMLSITQKVTGLSGHTLMKLVLEVGRLTDKDLKENDDPVTSVSDYMHNLNSGSDKIDFNLFAARFTEHLARVVRVHPFVVADFIADYVLKSDVESLSVRADSEGIPVDKALQDEFFGLKNKPFVKRTNNAEGSGTTSNDSTKEFESRQPRLTEAPSVTTPIVERTQTYDSLTVAGDEPKQSVEVRNTEKTQVQNEEPETGKVEKPKIDVIERTDNKSNGVYFIHGQSSVKPQTDKQSQSWNRFVYDLIPENKKKSSQSGGILRVVSPRVSYKPSDIVSGSMTKTEQSQTTEISSVITTDGIQTKAPEPRTVAGDEPKQSVEVQNTEKPQVQNVELEAGKVDAHQTTEAPSVTTTDGVQNTESSAKTEKSKTTVAKEQKLLKALDVYNNLSAEEKASVDNVSELLLNGLIFASPAEKELKRNLYSGALSLMLTSKEDLSKVNQKLTGLVYLNNGVKKLFKKPERFAQNYNELLDYLKESTPSKDSETVEVTLLENLAKFPALLSEGKEKVEDSINDMVSDITDEFGEISNLKEKLLDAASRYPFLYVADSGFVMNNLSGKNSLSAFVNNLFAQNGWVSEKMNLLTPSEHLDLAFEVPSLFASAVPIKNAFVDKDNELSKYSCLAIYENISPAEFLNCIKQEPRILKMNNKTFSESVLSIIDDASETGVLKTFEREGISVTDESGQKKTLDGKTFVQYVKQRPDLLFDNLEKQAKKVNYINGLYKNGTKEDTFYEAVLDPSSGADLLASSKHELFEKFKADKKNAIAQADTKWENTYKNSLANSFKNR